MSRMKFRGCIKNVELNADRYVEFTSDRWDNAVIEAIRLVGNGEVLRALEFLGHID